MPQFLQVRRLTETLRNYSDVGDPIYRKWVDDPNLLKRKQRDTAHRIAMKKNLSWHVIKSFFANHTLNQTDTNQRFRNLLRLVKEVVGSEESEAMIEGAAAYFFEVLYNVSALQKEHYDQLKPVFGTINPKMLEQIFGTVHKLVQDLNACQREELGQIKNSEDDDLMPEEFGSKIKFTHFDREKHPPKILKFYDDKSSASRVEFSMTYEGSNTLPLDEKPQPIRQPKKKQYNPAWLKKEIRKLSSGCEEREVATDVLVESIIHLLSSSKANDELQSELLDLMGVEYISLLEDVLAHRTELVQSNLISLTEPKALPVMSSSSTPAYSCQVTIQSEQEKYLRKQLRKGDKRSQRMEGREGATITEFNPQYLRDKREAQLIAAMQTPLFSNKYGDQAKQEKYPNVYDIYSEAKLSAAFIAGAKMTLPENATKKGNPKWEEVHIPAEDKSGSKIHTDLIAVDSLDEIGKQGFKGMKNLNQIQSMVFETAYYSNENLLICAPTGAGKTNIAMLTILHQIKLHMEDGIIMRDKFKIIYITPMKALAAEMTRNFGQRLGTLGLKVQELTGDMQMTKTEIVQTQMIVTTPEKWDVVTRKSTGDVALSQLVKLLILDEVHLLHGDRGPVLEAIVARTKRQVETSQSMIRIVGLSATLPSYVDVAHFLCVNPYKGLFFFDGRFRPVPLDQTFIGIKSMNTMQQMQDMDEVCYDKVSNMVDKGHQVMVFVHARNATVRTATSMRDLAQQRNQLKVFQAPSGPAYGMALKQIMHSRNRPLKELFEHGFSIHHAGMLRSDRNMVEKYFADGLIKVLVCTSTLAWGVNLPAHGVIIKGTEIYNSQRGCVVPLDILDVMQIFGRAGRPQYDSRGHGTIITTHDMLEHFLRLLTSQCPIESKFVSCLTDNLNAEVALGTVANESDAVEWLSYTYLFPRMKKNPLVYGLNHNDLIMDPQLLNHRYKIIRKSARELNKVKMIRYDEENGTMFSTDNGRISSHFYIKYNTIEKIVELKFMENTMNEVEILSMVSQAKEFDQLKVREDEQDELTDHLNFSCKLPVMGGTENTHGKVNILLQTYISRGNMDSFSLISDQAYVVQNSTRILRALFEMVLRQNNAVLTNSMLKFCKMVERQQWDMDHPLRQTNELSFEILSKLERKNLTLDKLRDLDSKEIGELVNHPKMGSMIKKCAHQLPSLLINPSVQPITRTILKVKLEITADFTWNDRVHGKGTEAFWIWIENPNDNFIQHFELFQITRKQVKNNEPQFLVCTIAVADPLPSQFIVRAVSDRWLGTENIHALSFRELIMPVQNVPHTELLDLQPLPKSALKNPAYEALYQFSHFNPIQTQVFHTLYHSNYNVMLGAPTGSGKTIVAEIAIFKVFRDYPDCKVVYIAPLKALVRERMKDWKIRLEGQLKKNVVELTGDTTPDVHAVAQSDVIVTTPEKWDGISRSWQTRNYVKDVALIVIDEIHLLGEDRGPVLEVIISRTNFISAHTEQPLRIVGLSTALANAGDVAGWLGIQKVGLYNFKSSVRPVPLVTHISGHPGKHYCPRMALMNKPTYQAIKQYSPDKPVLVFVSSRRQTRLTALDLIAFLAGEENPRVWLHIGDQEIDSIITTVRDVNLKLSLAFGIGLHHAGLVERDRKVVEELFVNQKIQVLIATSTLAWGVNFPAHLVVVKGTEYYDGKTHRYVDFPVTDVLQMIGRAGRPQFDDEGVAMVLVQDIKKDFYKKFLYEPFPVESSLLGVLADHLNAEIVAGTITTKQDCLDYLTWTYFFRRLLQNPSYYGLEGIEHNMLNKYMSGLIDRSLNTLQQSFCLELEEDERTLSPTTLGRIASYYYLTHSTIQTFRDKLAGEMTLEAVLQVLTDAHEYDELPVRHNEDGLNGELAKQCPVEVSQYTLDSPHTKAHLLFQAHFGQLPMPCSDYGTDLKSVLDQAIRILQAMIDICADSGWVQTTLRVIGLLQCVLQARWQSDNSMITLPHVEVHHLHCLRRLGVDSLPELMHTVKLNYEKLASVLRDDMTDVEIDQVYDTLIQLPVINCGMKISGWWGDSDSEMTKNISSGRNRNVRDESQWVPVHADQQYVLRINLTRISQPRDRKNRKALAHRFPKPKDEGWFLVLGHQETKELLAIKRAGYVHKNMTQQLLFYTPMKPGRVIYTLYLMSDCYIGLDQQYDIFLEVIEPSIRAQFHTEVSQSDVSLEEE